jgi:hypothetical protein
VSARTEIGGGWPALIIDAVVAAGTLSAVALSLWLARSANNRERALARRDAVRAAEHLVFSDNPGGSGTDDDFVWVPKLINTGERTFWNLTVSAHWIDGTRVAAPTTYPSLLPGRDQQVPIRAQHPLASKNPVFKVSYVDIDGSGWLRDSDGRIEQYVDPSTGC